MNRKIIKPTPFGSVGIIWTVLNDNPRIVRVLLSKPGLSAEHQASQAYPNSQASSCTEIDAVVAAIKGILEGDDIEIPLDVAGLDLCSAFQQSVLRAEHRIPRGSVSTYRLIATHLGKQNGARAVGNALANNPFPLIVPCHRAIRSDRHLGGYQGGLEMKRALLEKEGIRFDASERVVCAQFHYQRIMSSIVFIATSLDGYIADKDGGLDWLQSIPNPENLDMGWVDLIDRIDAVVMGRKTFEKVCSFDCDWPYSKPVFVLSNSMKSIPEGYEGKAEPIKGSLSEVIEAIHQKGYKHLYIDGGSTVQGFLKEDLIDEMIITVIPILLGGGIPLFGELTKPMEFEHVKTEVFLNAIVQNHYRRKK